MTKDNRDAFRAAMDYTANPAARKTHNTEMTELQALTLQAIIEGRTGNLNDRALNALKRLGYILPFARKSQIPVTIDGENALAAYLTR